MKEYHPNFGDLFKHRKKIREGSIRGSLVLPSESWVTRPRKMYLVLYVWNGQQGFAPGREHSYAGVFTERNRLERIYCNTEGHVIQIEQFLSQSKKIILRRYNVDLCTGGRTELLSPDFMQERARHKEVEQACPTMSKLLRAWRPTLKNVCRAFFARKNPEIGCMLDAFFDLQEGDCITDTLEIDLENQAKLKIFFKDGRPDGEGGYLGTAAAVYEDFRERARYEFSLNAKGFVTRCTRYSEDDGSSEIPVEILIDPNLLSANSSPKPSA